MLLQNIDLVGLSLHTLFGSYVQDEDNSLCMSCNMASVVPGLLSFPSLILSIFTACGVSCSQPENFHGECLHVLDEIPELFGLKSNRMKVNKVFFVLLRFFWANGLMQDRYIFRQPKYVETPQEHVFLSDCSCTTR